MNVNRMSRVGVGRRGCLVLLLSCVGLSAGATTVTQMTSNPETFEFRGNAKDDHLGGSSAVTTSGLAAGDLNNDGVGDIIIASTDDGTGILSYGAVQIVFGRGAWPTPAAASITNLANVKIVGRSGEKISDAVAVGDVNGDGITDLLIGSTEGDVPSSEVGDAYIFFGRDTWPSVLGLTNADVQIQGPRIASDFGNAVATGDINGDGVADVLVTAPYHSTNSLTWNGSVYAFWGRSTWPSSLSCAAADVMLAGQRSSAQVGTCVWTGDFNDDGIDELFFSAYHEDDPSHSGTPGYSGVVYGYLGRTSWFASNTASSASADLYVTGTGTDVYGLGFRGTCGDVNGDGIDDIAVLATDSPRPRVVFFLGQAGFTHLYATNLLAACSHIITYGNPNQNNGSPSAISCGDVDGDGLDDVLVGTSTASPNGALFSGWALLYYGRSLWGTNETADLQYNGEAAGNYFGHEVALGDVTGDGLADLLLNAPTAAGMASQSGKVYLLSGASSAAMAISAPLTSQGTLSLTVASRSGRTVSLERSTDLIHWERIRLYTSDGTAHPFSEPMTNSVMFYRAVANP